MPKSEVDTTTGEIVPFPLLTVEKIVEAIANPKIELHFPKATPEEAAAEIVTSILLADEFAPPPWVVSGKNSLGMPFEARRMVMRESDIVNEDEDGNEVRGWYISLEAVLADGSPAVINCGAPAFKARLLKNAVANGYTQTGPASYTFRVPRRYKVVVVEKKTARGYNPLNMEHVTDEEWAKSAVDFERANAERAEKVAKAGGPKF